MNKNRFLISILLATLTISACTNVKNSSNDTLKVIATESFLSDIAQNVAGNRMQIDTLVPVNSDPHAYQPTPGDLTRIANSQVLIVNGLDYETWLQKTLENIGGDRLEIIATAGLTPKKDPSGEHADGDPHMWMNPTNVIRYTENIRDGLIKADPSGRDVYTQNAEVYIQKLKDLDQWVKQQVVQLPQEKRKLVTNHDALGYFADAYGFTVIGAVIPSVTSEASPSAKQMASLIDIIKASDAPAIFLDISENRNLADQIAGETGVKVVTNLYVETLSAPNGPAPTYIDMIKHDVSQFITALK